MGFVFGALRSLAVENPLIQVFFFFGTWFLLWLPISIPLAYRLGWVPWQGAPSAQQKIPLVLSLYALLVPLSWLWLKVSNLSLADFGWQPLPYGGVSLISGLLIGFLGVWLAYGPQWLQGWVRWNLTHAARLLPLLLPLLFLGLVVGVAEEWVFRGFVLHQFQAVVNFPFAALFSSGLFAVLHLIWDGRAGLPQLPGLFLMGVVLAIATLVMQGEIALACGLHAGWVAALALLDSAQLTEISEQAPRWVTGRDGQALTGAAGILLLLLTGVCISAYGLIR